MFETPTQKTSSELIRAAQFGKRISMLLNLKGKISNRGDIEYQTQFGEKSHIGLGRTIISFLEESHTIKPK